MGSVDKGRCLCDAAAACSCKEDVYARIRKLRAEMAELRSHTGRDYDEKLDQLQDQCCKKDLEIQALKECCERSRNEIITLLGMLHNNNNEGKVGAGADCSYLHHLPESADMDEIRLQVQDLQRRTEEAEKQVHDMSLLLSKKTLEMSKLQLLHAQQSLRIVELSRPPSMQATSGVYSGRSSSLCTSALSSKLNASSDDVDLSRSHVRNAAESLVT